VHGPRLSFVLPSVFLFAVYPFDPHPLARLGRVGLQEQVSGIRSQSSVAARVVKGSMFSPRFGPSHVWSR
jgi:hypothetical protein